MFLFTPAPFIMQFSKSYCNRWSEVVPIQKWKTCTLMDYNRGGGPCTRKAKKQSGKASFVRLVEQQRNRASWVHETWWNHKCGCLLNTTRASAQCTSPEATKPHHKARCNLEHDNARPHIAQRTQETVTRLSCEVLSHPPFSHDLSPSDYHLFQNLQNSIDCKIFTSEDHVKNAVSSFFKQQDSNFF